MQPSDVHAYYKIKFAHFLAFSKKACWDFIFEFDLNNELPIDSDPTTAWSSTSTNFFEEGKTYAIRVTYFLSPIGSDDENKLAEELANKDLFKS